MVSLRDEVIVLALAAAVGACARSKPPPRADAGAVVAEPKPVDPSDAAADGKGEGTASSCAPPDPAKIAPFTCGAEVVKTPVPSIVDPKGALAPFHERALAHARGRARRHLRVAVYGDSNLLNDGLSGQLRRALQSRFGDGGHGFVALAHPWGGYRHEDVVQTGIWSAFKMYAPTTHLVGDKQYGFANVAGQSTVPMASVSVGTTKDPKAAVGRTASRFEIYFLKQPSGGSFRIELDGKPVRTVETRSEAFSSGVETVEGEDAPHTLKCLVTGDGPVRFFGASLEREPSGALVDGLGVGALNYERLKWVANGTRREQLTRRAYDLVILWIGTNVMWVPPNKEYAKEFIGELRAALPNVPILVLTPPDTVKPGETRSDPRIVAVAKQLREVAEETGAAFWDFREAMGGDGSMVPFVRRGLGGGDRVHLAAQGSHLMADRLACALWTDLGGYLEQHPSAGCAVE